MRTLVCMSKGAGKVAEAADEAGSTFATTNPVTQIATNNEIKRIDFDIGFRGSSLIVICN